MLLCCVNLNIKLVCPLFMTTCDIRCSISVYGWNNKTVQFECNPLGYALRQWEYVIVKWHWHLDIKTFKLNTLRRVVIQNYSPASFCIAFYIPSIKNAVTVSRRHFALWLEFSNWIQGTMMLGATRKLCYVSNRGHLTRKTFNKYQFLFILLLPPNTGK